MHTSITCCLFSTLGLKFTNCRFITWYGGTMFWNNFKPLVDWTLWPLTWLLSIDSSPNIMLRKVKSFSVSLNGESFPTLIDGLTLRLDWLLQETSTESTCCESSRQLCIKRGEKQKVKSLHQGHAHKHVHTPPHTHTHTHSHSHTHTHSHTHKYKEKLNQNQHTLELRTP